MEFVGLDEVWSELSRRGIVETRGTDGEVELSIDVETGLDAARIGGGRGENARRPCILELGIGAQGEWAIDVDSEKAAATLEAILHKLHLAPIYLIPVARWRNIFDVVSFGLAKNAHWQDIEAQACLELNTRDALECGLRDFHTVREVVATLLIDSEDLSGTSSTVGSPTEKHNGLMIVATGQLIVARVCPRRPIRVEIASRKVADNVRDAANHFLAGRGETHLGDVRG